MTRAEAFRELLAATIPQTDVESWTSRPVFGNYRVTVRFDTGGPRLEHTFTVKRTSLERWVAMPPRKRGKVAVELARGINEGIRHARLNPGK